MVAGLNLKKLYCPRSMQPFRVSTVFTTPTKCSWISFLPSNLEQCTHWTAWVLWMISSQWSRLEMFLQLRSVGSYKNIHMLWSKLSNSTSADGLTDVMIFSSRRCWNSYALTWKKIISMFGLLLITLWAQSTSSFHLRTSTSNFKIMQNVRFWKISKRRSDGFEKMGKVGIMRWMRIWYFTIMLVVLVLSSVISTAQQWWQLMHWRISILIMKGVVDSELYN